MNKTIANKNIEAFTSSINSYIKELNSMNEVVTDIVFKPMSLATSMAYETCFTCVVKSISRGKVPVLYDDIKSVNVVCQDDDEAFTEITKDWKEMIYEPVSHNMNYKSLVLFCAMNIIR